MEPGVKSFSINRSSLQLILTFVCLFLFIASTLLPFIWDPGKYIKYILPVVPFLFCGLLGFVKSNPLSQNYFLRNLILYSVLFGVSLVVALSDKMYSRLLVEAFLVISPLFFIYGLTLLSPKGKEVAMVKTLFFGSVLTYLFESGFYLFEILENPTLLIQGILTSTVESESGYSFVFGLFFLFFMMERNKTYSLIGFLLCVLSYKRIAIFGIIISCIFYFVFNKRRGLFEKNRKLSSFVFLAFNLIVVFLFFQLMSGRYDEYIVEHTGLSPNQFSLGRYDLYKFVLDVIGPLPLQGIGFGKTVDILYSHGSSILNFHSDIIKNFLEFGPLLFVIWLFSFYYFNSVSFKIFTLVLFVNIVFLTDNIFIYFEVMFQFYFLIFALLQKLEVSQLESPRLN